ncbi:DUF3375 domain-containing protein [Sulfurovum sp.]|jgi:hypothetical protein|uniref:DUF3375 domain-containing protein n=1 Tax=Sulfurovum sp. TaxID=1969726 RepID=UPI002A365261|nr:DUF3375 domain-containing protein [Sulfurovum sp.]MDD2450289.1 DUF3375 domain-containing protein [Sulfurovum sp.]MDD3499594.1 DUF3375 domain-containing protein [Sulfurovum sp.]MDY0401911.1 DUF3375 domain-containing protein [Sulfurovum sp.]
MTFEYLQNLKNHNKTIKLLSSDNLAMMASFFYHVFIEKKNITLSHSHILSLLDDYLFSLKLSYEGMFPRSAKEYLDGFCNDANGYLRKYHGTDDEPLYELTTHTTKALEFLQSLEQREFVGSRSKFNVIFELLEDLEFETNFDDEQRIKALEEEKQKLDEQINAIKTKQDIRFDSSRIKEHFMLLEETARKLKYDFTEIEYNFRDLNSTAMEQIATRDEGKEKVLDSIFDIEESIRNQDQGKSFFAFWQLLTDARKSERLSNMIENLYNNEVVKEFDKDEKLKSLKYELLKSAQKVSSVSLKLIEQLRRFIDDRAWLDNKRILELCKSIEKNALDIKSQPPKSKEFFAIKGCNPSIKSPFENRLHAIKQEKKLQSELLEKDIDIDLESFYHQFFIDEEILQKNINKILLHKSQCSMDDIVDEFGIKKGVAELIGYLSIAKNSENARVENGEKIRLKIEDFDGRVKTVLMPKIVFVK